MVNFDNFYYFMYRTIQDITGVDDVSVNYLYPHGSTDRKNICSRNPKISDKKNYAFLLYDQEPLTLPNVTSCNWDMRSRSYKRKVILGNSECGKIKQTILQHNRNLVDCHYFTHGFASLDWYRANKFYCLQKTPRSDFLLNSHGIDANRSYRILLIAMLESRALLENATYSMSFQENNQTYFDCIKNNSNMNADDYNFVEKYLQVKEDITYDKNFSSTSSAIVNDDVYKKVRFQIVAETCFFEDRIFLTEKVFQPIVTKTPFLLAAGPASLQYLKSYGFKTYEEFLPQQDHGHWRDRLDSIVNTTEWFCNLYPTEKNILCEEMQEIAEYNYNHFYGDFFEIIYEELKTNIKRTTEYCNSLPLAYSKNF